MEITIIGLAGLTVGLVEIVKQTGIKSKLIPFLALAIGVALAFVSGDFIKVATWQEKVLTGLMLGLSSMGLYSGGKTLGEK